MANLNGTPDFGNVYQLETNDPVIGGAPNPVTGAGKSNIPHLQLLNMALWLKDKIDTSGMGLTASLLVANWDAIAANGTYRSVAGAAGAPLPTGSFIGQHHANADPTSAWQLLTSVANGRTWIRTKSASVWGLWTELWTSQQSALSLLASGYMRLPNGMIQQWGRFVFGSSVGVTNYNVDVVFPTAFPTACFSIVASIGVSDPDYNKFNYRQARHAVSVAIPTLSGAQMHAFIDNETTYGRTVSWQAIGY